MVLEVVRVMGVLVAREMSASLPPASEFKHVTSVSCAGDVCCFFFRPCGLYSLVSCIISFAVQYCVVCVLVVAGELFFVLCSLSRLEVSLGLEGLAQASYPCWYMS